jgi:hypothetical protein
MIANMSALLDDKEESMPSLKGKKSEVQEPEISHGICWPS